MNDDWHANTRSHYRTSPRVSRWELWIVGLLTVIGLLQAIYSLATLLFS